MSEVFLYTDVRRKLIQIQKEVIETLSIENRTTRTPALRSCVSNTLATLAAAGIEDTRELTRVALIVGRKFLKELHPSLGGGNDQKVSAS